MTTCGGVGLAAKSCLTLATPWTVACQAPLAMGFCRQEYWSGLLLPPPGDLPDPGTEPRSFTSPALADEFFTTSATWEAPALCHRLRQRERKERQNKSGRREREKIIF